MTHAARARPKTTTTTSCHWCRLAAATSFQLGKTARASTSQSPTVWSTSSLSRRYASTVADSPTSSTSTSSSSATSTPPPPPSIKPSTLQSSLQPNGPPRVQKARSQRVIKARKAAVSLTPTAVERIKGLLDSPEPKLIRIGVRNKGCAGMSYHLEYVDKPEKFDEIVEQDGVKVVVDSKALFSIIGSTMDWQEDALQAKFVFNNPNIKDACGCGESFIV
ncbi:Iron-sulfur assembly protein 1 [Microbotryomycetes sp. JL201]|nr:Iron-sulfur assembly protein 1 [Microbotryomycetes sp. JL201]